MRDFIDSVYEEYKYVICVVLSGVLVLFFGYICFTIYTEHVRPKKIFMGQLEINLEVPQIPTRYVPDVKYFQLFGTVAIPDNYESYVTVDSDKDKSKPQVIVDPNANFNEESASFETQYEITNANQELYNIADKYYQVYWGSQRISPIYPLAVANVETGLRADHDVTWSALFPSKYVDISELYTMNVTTVVSDDTIYSALSKESSTRDRGALQMSPTYGTSNDYFNSLMSGTEKDKLKDAELNGHTKWASGASENSGDRFYVPDVCLRLASANTDAIQRIKSNGYDAKTDMHIIVMLAMYHHRSGVWSYTDHSKSVGEWKSGDAAYEFSRLISSDAMVSALKNYALEHPDSFWIDADTSQEIFKKVTERDMSDFASKKLVCNYPIKVLYAYIKLSIMYSK